MAAFHGDWPILDVNHKNGLKSDNSLSNLEYATRAGNMHDAFATGLCENTRKAASAILKDRWAQHQRRMENNEPTKPPNATT